MFVCLISANKNRFAKNITGHIRKSALRAQTHKCKNPVDLQLSSPPTQEELFPISSSNKRMSVRLHAEYLQMSTSIQLNFFSFLPLFLFLLWP